MAVARHHARPSPALRAVALVLAGWATLLSASCQSPRTEVIIAVDADANILALSDAFRIEVAAPMGGEPRTATASLSDGQPLPRTLGLYWSGGSLGPYRATVTAMRGTSSVVARVASFSFIPDRTVVLHVTLVGACLTTTCPAGQTCAENGCRSSDIDPAELEPYTGTIARRDTGAAPVDASRPDAFMPPPLDASIDAFVPMPDVFVPDPDAFVPDPDAFVPDPDAFVPPDAFAPPDAFGPDTNAAGDAWVPDGCTPAGESCNMRDDDCDLRTDEGFDLTTDLMNCGMCGNGCAVANGTPECVGSMCGVASCDMNFDDCNMDPDDGCEADLRSDEMNCRTCGTVCMGGRMCCRGMCRFSCP